VGAALHRPAVLVTETALPAEGAHQDGESQVANRSARLPWLIVAGYSILVGLAAFALYLGRDWSIDGDHALAVARRFLSGESPYDPAYLYSPLAIAFTIPWTVLPQDVALVGWALVKLLVAAVVVAWVTRDLVVGDRVVAIVASVTFIGVLHDAALGNVNVLIVAAVALTIGLPDRWASGVPLGLILAAVPKPWLLPFLIWAIAFRRRSLGGAFLTAGVATFVGVLIAGPGMYETYLRNLGTAPDFSPYDFNLAFTHATPELALVMALVAVVVLIAIMVGGDEDAALVAAIAAGVLVSPYLGFYSAVPLLLTIRPLVRIARRAALVLVGVGPILTVLALPWLAVALVVTAAAASVRSWKREVEARSTAGSA
jgi:hypothetical protein